MVFSAAYEYDYESNFQIDDSLILNLMNWPQFNKNQDNQFFSLTAR